MSIYAWFVVILVTSLAAFTFGCWANRPDPEPEPDPAPPPQELPRAGRFEVEYLPGPPFAGAQDHGYEFDTGPLLIWSESAAAQAQLERDIRWMIEAAERKIGPVQ